MEKTNGDICERARLVEEIRLLIKNLGWSQNRAAEVIYYYRFDTDNDEDLKSFQERFKKHLQRGSTSIELLSKYLDDLVKDPEVKRSGAILNSYVPSGELSQELSIELRRLSEEIAKKIRTEDIG